MVQNTENVTSAKPNIGGALFRAPLGTPLPKNTEDTLNTAFQSLGYISDDGLTNAFSPSTEKIKAWGGDIVNAVPKEKSDTFSFTLIEAINVEVLKMVYGDNNVKGTIATGLSIHVNSKALEAQCLVVEMILKNNILKRIVISNCLITEIDEVVYADGKNVGYRVKVEAFPDAKGDTHDEYMKKGA